MKSKDLRSIDSVWQTFGVQPPRGEWHFLVFEQESAQRNRLGETLTVKSIVTASVMLPTYPDFKPLSPKTPSRPLSVAYVVSPGSRKP